MANNNTDEKTTGLSRATTDKGIKVFCLYDDLVDLNQIKPNPKNPNKHPEEQVKLLAEIIKKNGWRQPITVSKQSGYIVKGHARREAGILAGGGCAPVEYQDYETEADEIADLIADNRIAELAVLDKSAIEDLLQELDRQGYPAELTGYTSEQIEEIIKEKEKEETVKEEARATLSERFIITPFSVFDARSGAWQERKSAWKRLGIKSEIGRGNDDSKTSGGLLMAASAQPISTYKVKEEYEKKAGKISWDTFAYLFPEEMQQGGTSIFDPVLCEIGYRWYCPEGGRILDPFSGGSVRGIVAALTGRSYTGIDISERQISANKENWREIEHKAIIPGKKVKEPEWIAGDSKNIDTLAHGEYDLLFSCPPYADLEVYSQDPGDLSNKEYPEFIELYRDIIKKSVGKLKKNSFAIFVVGDVRGKDGFYYNFVSDTIRAFTDAGMKLYNEAIYVQQIGSLAVRVSKQFQSSRKLGKNHQNVLIFNNGKPEESAAFCTKTSDQFEGDINAYLRNDKGKLGRKHEKVLVFANGDVKEATKKLPKSAEQEGDILSGISYET